MIGMGLDSRALQRLAGLAVLAAAWLAAEGALAAVVDPVPLPRPRPHLAAVSAPAAPAAQPTLQPAAQPADEQGGLKLPKFLQPKKKQPASQPSQFTPEEEAALASISDYFNSFRTMEGQFIQVGPNGEQSEGVFFIAKPGKIRFHYRPPVKLDVIADGSSVAIRNNKARTQELYPLSKTPLKYLLADNIDLTSGDTVSQVKLEPDIISVVIVQKSAFVDGKLTMIFDRKTSALKQWIVTDNQNLNTSVAVFDIATGKPQDPGLFRIVINNP